MGVHYYCAKRGLAVIVLSDTAPIKACNCKAAIIASMEAKELKGTGDLKLAPKNTKPSND